MSQTEMALVDDALRVLGDPGWKSKLDAVLEDTEAKLQESLDEQEEVLRLETDKIRGMESHLESQVEKVRALLASVEASLEEDRASKEKLLKKRTELSVQLLEEEATGAKLDAQIKELSSRALTTAELEKHFPEQKMRQSLFFRMVRVVFAKTKKSRPHAFRGYVSNVAGTDVTPFEFDTLNVDQARLADYLWDYVADGVSDQFKKLK